MKNALETLRNSYLGSNNQIHRFIAKVIIKNYFKMNFLNQKELAKECYVVESTITKFSKSLGFSGYKELIILLKNESKKYIQKTGVFDLEYPFLFTEYVKKEIFDNSKFINNLVTSIRNHKTIYLISSYQTISIVEFFRELLQSKNKIVFFSQIRHYESQQLINFDFKKDLMIIFTFGQDNEW